MYNLHGSTNHTGTLLPAHSSILWNNDSWRIQKDVNVQQLQIEQCYYNEMYRPETLYTKHNDAAVHTSMHCNTSLAPPSPQDTPNGFLA